MKMIDQDKANHAALGPWCALAGLLAGWVLHVLVPAVPRHDAVAAAAGLLLAADGREAYGLATGGVWDWADFGATLAGGAPVVAVAALAPGA